MSNGNGDKKKTEATTGKKIGEPDKPSGVEYYWKHGKKYPISGTTLRGKPWVPYSPKPKTTPVQTPKPMDRVKDNGTLKYGNDLYNHVTGTVKIKKKVTQIRTRPSG